MASFDLSWTPAGSLISVSQQVQYKAAASSTWLVAATLSATANSYTVEGLEDNTIYDFRIVTDCAFGGPTPSASYQIIDFVCPHLTITPDYESVSFSFIHSGGSVDSYLVELTDDVFNEIFASTSFPLPSGALTHTFTDLDQNTDYGLRITIVADVYSEECRTEFTTAFNPVCETPSNVTVEMILQPGSF
jgi:hypothetical protein